MFHIEEAANFRSVCEGDVAGLHAMATTCGQNSRQVSDARIKTLRTLETPALWTGPRTGNFYRFAAIDIAVRLTGSAEHRVSEIVAEAFGRLNHNFLIVLYDAETFYQ